MDLHFKYGLGIPLSRKLHKLFHKIYGVKNNTEEQFKEFVENYNNGDFENIEIDIYTK